jgi:hypothetical protein
MVIYVARVGVQPLKTEKQTLMFSHLATGSCSGLRRQNQGTLSDTLGSWTMHNR